MGRFPRNLPCQASITSDVTARPEIGQFFFYFFISFLSARSLVISHSAVIPHNRATPHPMASLYNFKKIAPVPTASDFLDIVLSKTQRKTPTVIHKNYAIGRIRNFYIRKVKFTQDSFEEKFKAILEEFPKLDVSILGL